MIRVLHLRASNFLGGPERQILRYCSEQKAAHYTQVIGSFAGEREGREFLEAARAAGIDCLELPVELGVLDCVSRVADYVLRHNVQVICSHGYKPAVIAELARRKAAFAHVPFLRGWTKETLRVRLFEALERWTLKNAERVVCLSAAQAMRIAKIVPSPGKIRVVNNAIALRSVSPEERRLARKALLDQCGLSQDAQLVCSAGRLSPEKGQEVLVRAFAEVAHENARAHLIVFGHGPLRLKLEALARRLGLAGRVTFAGHSREFLQMLPGADLLVNPSFSEEMPNVVLEAMAAGVPVLATSVGGVPEIAGDDAACELADAGDACALWEGILRLLNDESARTMLAQRGLDRVRNAYSLLVQQTQLEAVLAELAPEPAHAELPKISVILPVRNEAAHIRDVLEALLKQDYPQEKIELLVVDGMSTDGTPEVVQSVAGNGTTIRLLQNPKRLSSAARNVGAQAMTGDVALFVDGHCFIPDNQLLMSTARAMLDRGALCLARPQPLTAPGNTWLQQAIADARSTVIGHGRDSTIFSLANRGWVDPTSSGAAYSRKVFDQVGYFDENFDACEDVEFNHRVFQSGIKAFLDPAFAVFYHPRKTLGALLRQTFRYGKGRVRFARKHPRQVSLAQLVPALVVLWLPLDLLCMLLFPRARWVCVALILAYFAALAVGSLEILARKGSLRSALLTPLVLMTVHFGFGWGQWSELLAGKKAAEPRKMGMAVKLGR